MIGVGKRGMRYCVGSEILCEGREACVEGQLSRNYRLQIPIGSLVTTQQFPHTPSLSASPIPTDEPLGGGVKQ